MELKYKVGDTVQYRDEPDNKWVVTRIDDSDTTIYVHAEKKGHIKMFAAQVLRPIKAGNKKPNSRSSGKKIQNINDDVAKLLQEADDLEEMLQLAGIVGINVEDLKNKISHLSNGLKRMNIGNRIRRLVKVGLVDVEKITKIEGKFVISP